MLTDAWRYQIYEFLDERGHSVIGGWLARERITKRDRALLTAKMDLLAQHGALLGDKLFAGPIASKTDRKMQSHIYKLIVHGDRMLRPMFCKGPHDMDNEFTMLLGAIEANGVLDHDAAEAEANRTIILGNPRRRALNGRYS